MKDEVRLSKLLTPRQITPLLRSFARLLGPETSLFVSDNQEHILAAWQPESRAPCSPELIPALWQAVEQTLPSDDAPPIAVTSQGAAAPLYVEKQLAGMIAVAGTLPLATKTRAALTALKQILEPLAELALEKRAVAREALERYREINLLYSLGETLVTCLDADTLLQRALTEASQSIHARHGAILLQDESGDLTIAASTGSAEVLETATTAGRTLLEEVAHTGKPQIANELSYRGQNISLLIAPLLTSERQLGVILLTGKAGGEIFTAGDQKLLSALAWQTAVALENARLFDDVRKQRDEIATMKSYMDNIFASITSGVITIDPHDIVTTFNQAAERILLVPAHEAVNRPYHQALRFLLTTPLPDLIENIHQRGGTHVDQEISLSLPQGKQVHLNVSLSPLQSSGGEALGIAIVLDDLTEKRRYEQERTLLKRYLPYGLVDLLPHNLAELRLRNERRVLTVLFADIKRFTTFSEINPPERVMDVLNNYMTLAEAAVRFNRGIVDKYVGDAIMALFNTPLLEEAEHAWRAVQTAWTLKEAIEAYHRYVTPDERLFFGFGICTGIAVVGNMGTEDRMEYTAVGDTVNLAKRLQENAKPGQILIGHRTWKTVQHRVQATPLPATRLRGRQSFTRVYELTNLIQTDETKNTR